jgi:hypothetical protein
VVAILAGIIVFRTSRQTCEVRWRVGDIDPRFSVSGYAVQNAASNAADAWNTAAGKRVLWFDKTHGIPLNLIFNTGHTAIAQNIALLGEIRRLAAEIDYLKPQFERNQSQYVADRINRSIHQYNRLITTFNETPQREIRQGSYQDDMEVYAFADTTDLKIVIAHEFGHALGAGHVDEPDAVMKARSRIGTTSALRLHPADIDALKKGCSL